MRISNPGLVNQDAWKILQDLRDEFTSCFEVRDDLRVDALGLERTVRFTMYDGHPHDLTRPSMSTERNVVTMRQLAHALLDACDFVEKSNPKWAGQWSGSTLPFERIGPEA